MIRRKTTESGSTRNSKGILSVPELIQEKIFTTFSFWEDPCSSTNTSTETMNDAKMLTDAIAPLRPLLILFPKNPLIINPISGNKGTSDTNLIIYSYLQFLVRRIVV